MLGKNEDKDKYNYAKYNDNSDNPIIYLGYIFLGLFILAIFL